MNLKDNILNRIDELIQKDPERVSLEEAGEISLAVTSIFETIYGPRSPQLELVERVRKQIYDGKTVQRGDEFYNARLFARNLNGFLRNLASDIRGGRIANIQSEARGEVLGDFLVLAREVLDAGQKDVASVLACAALEDTLKRCASDRGLDVQDKTMPSVVNALKTVGVIHGTQSALLSAFVKIRNSAFHARWDEIDVRDVKDIARFTEEFLAKQFSASLTADSSEDTSADA